MPSTRQNISRFASTWSRHLALIALLIGLSVNSWLAWQGWLLWADAPLPPERVTAKQLRVDESKRLLLTQNLDHYRHPPAVTPTLKINFQAAATTVTPVR